MGVTGITMTVACVYLSDGLASLLQPFQTIGCGIALVDTLILELVTFEPVKLPLRSLCVGFFCASLVPQDWFLKEKFAKTVSLCSGSLFLLK